MKKLTLILTPHQADLILNNVPKGCSIKARGKDLDKIIHLANKTKQNKKKQFKFATNSKTFVGIHPLAMNIF